MIESQLYDKDGLFHNIIKQSAIMQGRYVVLPNKGQDLNAGNILSGLELPDIKYPLVGCFPPYSNIDSKGAWEWLTFNLLFVNTTYYSGDNQIKNPDPNTNTSLHRISQDWQEMKQEALLFRAALIGMQMRMVNTYHIDDRQPFNINRITNMQTDRVSGVLVNFGVALKADCVFSIDVSQIQIPV